MAKATKTVTKTKKSAKASRPGKAAAKPATRSATKKVDSKQAKADAIALATQLAPELEARIGNTPRTKYRGNPDLFGRLVEDHDRHRALLAMIEATEPKGDLRKSLFYAFVSEIKAHAAAEEQALWSAVLKNPDTTDVARHAVAEHKELDDMIADLAARDMSKAGWLKRFAVMKEEYLHHIQEEEQEQFVDSEKLLSAADLKQLRGVFERRKKAEKPKAVIEKKIKLK